VSKRYAQTHCNQIDRNHNDVRQEFATLPDDANVYKLVGPVLLKQDTSEAKSTVDGRLEYINKEMYVIEASKILCSFV